ncbi:MAG TPA: MFS transporter [Streptosporangiaceae bacterium]|jgi:MFS family permease
MSRGLLLAAPRPAVIRRSPRAPWLAVGVVCFGAFMGQLDASIVTLTFAPMQRAFGAPLAAVQWVSLGYLLALVALLAPAGRIADIFGRKLVYGYGFIVFTAGSAACALAPGLGLLIGCRLVQAAGAAMLQANSVALVTTSVPRDRMRLALSIQAAAQAIGLGLGPTLGGLLAQSAGWRAVYWINVPVGCAAVLAGRYLLPRTRQLSPPGPVDWPGAAALAAATTALLLVLSHAAGLPLPGWSVIALGAAAIAAGAAFAVRERRAAAPLIPVALLRSRRVTLGLAGALLGYLTLFGPLVLIPAALAGQQQPGHELRAGLLLSVLPASFGLAALAGEAVPPRSVSSRLRGCAGAACCAAALAALAALPLTTTAIAACLAAAGLGLGVFVPANNAVIMSGAPAASAAVLGGLVSAARGIGTTLGIALVALALHAAGPALALALLAGAAATAALVALAGTPRSARPPGAAHGT